MDVTRRLLRCLGVVMCVSRVRRATSRRRCANVRGRVRLEFLFATGGAEVITSALEHAAPCRGSLVDLNAAYRISCHRFTAIRLSFHLPWARTCLRALGFCRRSILASFLIESVILALIGGAIGCLLAFPMNGFSTGTGQTQSFSEIAFAFRITPGIVMTWMAFAVAMGVLGGLLPALRGARLPITSALREA